MSNEEIDAICGRWVGFKARRRITSKGGDVAYDGPPEMAAKDWYLERGYKADDYLLQGACALVVKIATALTQEATCQTCAGTGVMEGSCEHCNELGYRTPDCGECKGAGRWEQVCAECDGIGWSVRCPETMKLLGENPNLDKIKLAELAKAKETTEGLRQILSDAIESKL